VFLGLNNIVVILYDTKHNIVILPKAGSNIKNLYISNLKENLTGNNGNIHNTSLANNTNIVRLNNFIRV
jgi:hypothetical protein